MYTKNDFTERVAVVVPIYKNDLAPFEEVALRQCLQVLGKHKVFVIKPRSVELTFLSEYDFITCISFDDEYFISRQGYNRLMLWDGFYETFLNFEYILIYQLDAFVFRDKLIEWCDKGYDYVGAPWLRSHKYIDIIKAVKSRLMIYIHTRLNIKQPLTDLPTTIQFENKVGNGGLSLRRVRKFYEAAKKFKHLMLKYHNRVEHTFNEDVWWAIELNRKRNFLKIPGYKKAVFFSFENEPQRALELTHGELPFGCHAWNRHLDFWRGKIVINHIWGLGKRPQHYNLTPYNYSTKLAFAGLIKMEMADGNHAEKLQMRYINEDQSTEVRWTA